MKCPHCARDVMAERTGDGVRVRYGLGPAFVIASPCPYPRCARAVFARAAARPIDDYPLVLMKMAGVVSWSLRPLLPLLAEWFWPCALLAAFTLIPAWGLTAAVDSLRCGGVGWCFFVAGSLLALVPVVYFVRALACAAFEELRLAHDSRATLRAGGTGGLRLTPTPTSYRIY